MEPKRILFATGPTPIVSGKPLLKALAFAEPGFSTDQLLFMIGNGTSAPHLFQSTNTKVTLDFTATPGVAQRRYYARAMSTPAAPAYQTNQKADLPSGICEPADGDVGIVVNGVLIGTFTSTGLKLNGQLTYTGQGGVVLPFGTNAQRPDPAPHGFLWHNTTIDILEWYDEFAEAWRPVGEDGGGGSGLTPWEHISANTNAVAGGRYIANTDGGGFNLVLPAAPADKTEIAVQGDFATRKLTIVANGKLIARQAANADYELNQDGQGVILTYDNNIGSWRVRNG